MNNWKEYRLGKLAKFSNGINFDKDAYFGSGIRLITVSDFGSNFSPDYKSLIEVSNEVVKEKDLISKNDILFVRSNGNKELVGRCMLIDNVDKPTTYSGFCIKCHFDNEEVSNPKYFTYYFKNQYFRKCISNASGGTNIQNLNQEILSKHKVQLPPIITQQKIAHILSRYDEAIENNNKRIKLLEQMAQNPYKEWFVRFRFPGWENCEFKNGIPKGWKVSRLKEFGKIVTGKTPPTEKSEYYSGDIMFVKTPDIHGKMFVQETTEYLSLKGCEFQKAQYLPENSIMVSCIGTGGITSINAYPANTNQQINSIILDDLSNLHWLYFTVAGMKETIEMYGNTGTTMTNLSKGKFEKLKVIKPCNELIQKFSNIINPIFERIKLLNTQITNLAKQRDLLLPRLMSGKLEVK